MSKSLTIKTTLMSLNYVGNRGPDHAENLHKHSHVAVLSTDAYKLQISATKSTFQVDIFQIKLGV